MRVLDNIICKLVILVSGYAEMCQNTYECVIGKFLEDVFENHYFSVTPCLQLV